MRTLHLVVGARPDPIEFEAKFGHEGKKGKQSGEALELSLAVLAVLRLLLLVSFRGQPSSARLLGQGVGPMIAKPVKLH